MKSQQINAIIKQKKARAVRIHVKVEYPHSNIGVSGHWVKTSWASGHWSVGIWIVGRCYVSLRWQRQSVITDIIKWSLWKSRMSYWFAVYCAVIELNLSEATRTFWEIWRWWRAWRRASHAYLGRIHTAHTLTSEDRKLTNSREVRVQPRSWFCPNNRDSKCRWRCGVNIVLRNPNNWWRHVLHKKQSKWQFVLHRCKMRWKQNGSGRPRCV